MKTPRFIPPLIPRVGFTLVELLVSMVVLTIIMLMSARFIGQMQRTWSASSARLEQFREARTAFETITQALRQATLNTYLTYEYNTGPNPTVPSSKDEAPRKYVRHSELQFVTGRAADLLGSESPELMKNHAVFLQAPMGITARPGYEGLQRLLCGRGYFIKHGSDETYRPQHVSTERVRFRLWEYRPFSEMNEIYSVNPGGWFSNITSDTVEADETVERPSQLRPIAENIVALIISPQVTAEDARERNSDKTWIAPNYAYDSTTISGESVQNPQGTQHLLPPVIVVTLVAIDEASAQKLADRHGDAVPDLIPDGSFESCDDFAQDLAALEANLAKQKLNYRVFTAAVPMRNSKWNQMYR
ncbi:Verru_Chthon cassette protein C [Prosthecobacter debontii]|uniref:Verru_Chthon cassette protein C n=1 Tax=Prosthecobacter debontii TaxID=48467 RepID=A0A1T4XGN6_9BACT|nr:Verru_Chthon cassette protein C [Prosthecobacter debontii]SKA88726.1 Verru_Chthon cassette protein C [Prosthecobacter debontii]